MKNEIIERIVLDHDETFHADKAARLLDWIRTEIPESSTLDEQILPDVIEALVLHALRLEDARVWSVFNVLNDESRMKLRKAIIQRGEEKLNLKGDETNENR